MRYAILSVLLLSLFSGCNRDATDARSPDGSFLSPANQPQTNAMPSKEVDGRPLEGTVMIEGHGEEVLEEGGKVIEGRLSAEDLATLRRPGSRRPPFYR